MRFGRLVAAASPAVLIAALGAALGTAAIAVGGPVTTSSTSAAPAVAPAGSVPTMDVSEVKPGMEGYGLTVFQGTVPDRFHIVVLGVLHDFLPKQDLILIKSDDPRLVYSGVVKGMSGSPIYIDGKLVGALAYAWSFSKDAIAGVTPIKNMEAELHRPVRGPDSTLMAAAGEIDLGRFRADPFAPAVKLPATASADGAARIEADATVPPLFDALPLPPRPVVDAAADPRLVQAAVPLMVSGMPPRSLASLASVLAPYGIDVMAGGGAGDAGAGAATGGPSSFQFGDSIGVELARGDVSMAGVGTVTWVDGSKVLGFGHPMFGAGEIYLPITTANVTTILSSLDSSIKMASPIKELGTLVQDRQACILGDTSRMASVVPVDITVTGVGAPRVYHTEVARHRFLTPVLAQQVIAAALQDAVSDVATATVTVDGTLHIDGFAPLELVDDVYSQDGVSANVLAQVRAIRYLAPLLFNPFAPVDLRSLDIKLDVSFKPLIANVQSAFVSESTLPPGGTADVYVTLQPYGEAPEVVSVPLDIPASLTGQSVKILVDAGSQAQPDVAPPQNLRELVDGLRKSYPANSLVVTLLTDDNGVVMDGQVVPDLPPSVLDALRPAGSSDAGAPFHTAERVVVPTPRVVQGHQEISVKVRDVR